MKTWTLAPIPVDETATLDSLFLERVRRSPARVAYRWFDRAQDGWRQQTWAEMGHAVARWRHLLPRADRRCCNNGRPAVLRAGEQQVRAKCDLNHTGAVL